MIEYDRAHLDLITLMHERHEAETAERHEQFRQQKELEERRRRVIAENEQQRRVEMDEQTQKAWNAWADERAMNISLVLADEIGKTTGRLERELRQARAEIIKLRRDFVAELKQLRSDGWINIDPAERKADVVVDLKKRTG